MKIIVIGGTGLLGHEAVEYALSQGHEVTSMDINDAKSEEWFTNKAKSVIGNVFTMTEEEMPALLASDGMLVKRPLLIGNDFVLVGFKEGEWNEALSK